MKLEDFMCSYTNIRGAMAPARPPYLRPWTPSLQLEAESHLNEATYGFEATSIGT